MNKRALIVVLALVIVIGGAIGVFAVTRPATEPVGQPTGQGSVTQPAAESGSSSAPAAPATAEAGGTASTAGAYVEYSDTAIAAAEGRTFLFFYASWCPICRTLDGDIVASGVPAGVTIIKVDYDSHQDLRQKYGVTQQTTIVEVDAAGNGLQNYLAYDDPSLQTVLDAML